jgi:hypothetical protein
MAEERTGFQQLVSDRSSTNECLEVRGYRFQPSSASGREGTATRHRHRSPTNRDNSTGKPKAIESSSVTPHSTV